jgi:putative ABC transport system permease protein
VEGRPEATPEGGSVTNYRGLMPGYLESMGIPLLAGHMLRPDEGSGSSWVGLVNRNLAERLWPGGSPIGSRVIIDAGSTLNPVEIGGVVGDVKHSSLEDRPVFDLYVPLRQVPPILTKWLALRTYWVLQAEPDPAALAAPARRILADLDPEAAVSNVRSMEEALAAPNARRRFQLYLFELSAAAAPRRTRRRSGVERWGSGLPLGPGGGTSLGWACGTAWSPRLWASGSGLPPRMRQAACWQASCSRSAARTWACTWR